MNLSRDKWKRNVCFSALASFSLGVNSKWKINNFEWARWQRSIHQTRTFVVQITHKWRTISDRANLKSYLRKIFIHISYQVWKKLNCGINTVLHGVPSESVFKLNIKLQWQSKCEPPHDKTNKMTRAPSEDSDQPGYPPSLNKVFAVRSMESWGPTVSSCGQRKLWSDWADAQADLSLRWAHMSFCWFCHEAASKSWNEHLHQGWCQV